MSNEFGEVVIFDGFMQKSFPFYACGHCSAPVVMNPNRKRERRKCLGCSRWICETNELCQSDCTPIYALANDHFEDKDGKWTKNIPAIMAGCQTVDEARSKGLL